jgi:hypothetical protein
MANLLSYQEILNETALNQIPAFFHNLPVLQRARCVCSAAARPSDAWARFGHCTPNHTPPWSRHTYSPTLTIPPSPHTFTCVWLSAIHRWRWIFPEPGSSLSYPRQRARREMEEDADWAHADLMMVTDENGLPPHHRIAPVFKVNRASEEEWKANALKSTNTLLDKLPRGDPETNMFTSLKTWLAMIELAHSQALLRPGGLEVIRAWAQSATERQRSALNNLLLKGSPSRRSSLDRKRWPRGSRSSHRAARSAVRQARRLCTPTSAILKSACVRRQPHRSRQRTR